MPQSDFKELKVWREAFELAKEIYLITTKFPKDEMYGMTSQIRRATVSISNNIAEGCGRNTSKDFISFLYNSMGSCKEVENLLMLAKELKYIGVDDFNLLNDKVDHIGKMLTQFIKSVNNRN